MKITEVAVIVSRGPPLEHSTMKLMNFKILISFLSGTCHSPVYSHTAPNESFPPVKNYFEKQKLTVNFQFSKTLDRVPSHFYVPSSFHIKQTGLEKLPKRRKKKQKLDRALKPF